MSLITNIFGFRTQKVNGWQSIILSGKQIIHPAQIQGVNQAFSPTEKQVDYAKRLLHTFDIHQNTGKVTKYR